MTTRIAPASSAQPLRRARRRTALALLVVAAGVVAAACGGSASTADTEANSTTATSPAATTEPVPETTASSDTTVAAQGAWETVEAPSDCMCSDGAPFEFYVREADPTKVVFFLEGGGACFSAATCAPESNTFKRTAQLPDDLANGTGDGIWSESNPDNPIAGWSVVYVPYCTGDVHIGNATTDYGDGLVMQHKGYANASAALGMLAYRFPNATELLVTGESAGSVPSPMYAGMASDLLPDARITVLADGSGAYPDVPAINNVIGSLWGTMNAVPDWPVNEGMTVERWSLPGLFVQAAAHAPDIVFARHDFAFDETQVFFAGLAGIPADDLVQLIDRNETQVEAGGMSLWSFISPGDEHTILHRADFYTHEVEGVRLVDWVRALLAGEPVVDVHCVECTVG
ncbi:MAG: pectin acetylesterase-family hydrolase [Ilumatobacteraceae bacterium]